jgi:hypothetical protein
MTIKNREARIRRIIWATSLIALGVPGCHLGGSPVPPAPPATEFEIAASPGTVLRRAADALQAWGWWVAPVDTGSGQLRAEHHSRGDANGQWMACVNSVGRTGDTRRATKDLTSTVVVQLRAEKKGSGSQVRIIGTVPSAYSLFAFTEKGPPEYAVAECVSSGAIESRIRDALIASR